jgi:hypothetical protein
MPETTESSVVIALSELQRIEAERIAEEAARKAEQVRQEAERLRREREERDEAARHRLRVAEAEARLRLVEEVRSAEAVQRAARMEEELRDVKAERNTLSAQLLTRPQEPPPGELFLHGTVGALILCTIAAGLGVLFWPAPRKPLPPPVAVAAQQPPPAVVPDPKEVECTAAAEKKLKELALYIDKLERERKLGATRPSSRPVHPTKKPEITVSSENVDALSQDPLGGLTMRGLR